MKSRTGKGIRAVLAKPSVKWSLIPILFSALVLSAVLGGLAFRSNTRAAEGDEPLSRYLTFTYVDQIEDVGFLPDGGYVISGFVYHGNAKLKSCVIPAQFNGYPVVGIEASVFSGVQKIGDVTFNTISDSTGSGPLAYDGEDTNERGRAFGRMPTECRSFGTAIRSIGDYCFSASSITSITLPASIAEIGDGAFINCTSLTKIQSFSTLKTDGTPSAQNDFSQLMYCKRFGSKCFMVDSKLNIAYNALPDFNGGEGKTDYYPEGKGLEEIGDTCFNLVGCSVSETYRFIIPASCKNIIEDPFYGFTSTHTDGDSDQYVTVKGNPGDYEYYPWGFNVKRIQWSGSHTKRTGNFYYNDATGVLGPVATDYEGKITVPHSANGVTFTGLASGTFAKRDKITGVEFANGWEGALTELPTKCFYQCSKLATVTNLPNSIKKIGTMAFSDCKALTQIGNTANTVEIPTSCTTIGYWAFHACSAFATCNIRTTAPASDFRISQAAFVGCTLSTLEFHNLTSGTPHDIINLSERPEEWTVWGAKTYPFGVQLGLQSSSAAKAHIYYRQTADGARTDCGATVVASGNWTCMILPEPKDSVEILKYTGTVGRNGTITVPATLSINGKDYKVYRVGNVLGANAAPNVANTRVLSGNNTTLIISSGIEEIGYQAFNGTFASVQFTEDSKNKPSTLKKIDDMAFIGATINSRLNFPDTLETIGLRAFDLAKGMTNDTVVFSGYLKNIDGSAFMRSKWNSLTDVFYLQYRTQESDSVFSPTNGFYKRYTGAHSSSAAGVAGMAGQGGNTPTVHYMDDYSPYAFELGTNTAEPNPEKYTGGATGTAYQAALDAYYESYRPVIDPATDKGNHAYDSPYAADSETGLMYMVPYETYDDRGTFIGYKVNVRFGVRMMTQEYQIYDVTLTNTTGTPVKYNTQGKTGGDLNKTNQTNPKDLFMVFLDGVSADSTYVFNIEYKNEKLNKAITDAGLTYFTGQETFVSKFTVSANIYAAVNFQHAIMDNVQGTLPTKMKEDEEGKAMLNTPPRIYGEELTEYDSFVANGKTVKLEKIDASWGKDGAISTVTLPSPKFNHPSAEFIGWTTDPTVGGVIWASAEPTDGEGNRLSTYYPAGSEITVTHDELDANHEITVYSVFRLKINKNTTSGSDWKWVYGNDPYTADRKYFNLPVSDKVAAGGLTLIRVDSKGTASIAKTMTFDAGFFNEEFDKAYSPSTNAGKYLVLAGNIATLSDTNAADYDTWRDNLVKTLGNTYVVSEFEVTPAELGTGTETGTAANNSKIVDLAKLAENKTITYNREQLVDGISLQFNADETLSLTADADYTTELLYWDDSKGGTVNWNSPTDTYNGSTADVLEHVEDRGQYRLVLTGKAQTVSGGSGYGYTDGNYSGTYIIDFTVNPAEISLNDMSETQRTYNREAQWLNVQSDVLKNTRTVGNIIYTVPNNDGATPEYGVWYKAQSGVNMKSGFDGDTERTGLLPYYADTYDVTVILLGNGQRNFKMTGSTGPLTVSGTPYLVTSEPTRSGEDYDDYKWTCNSRQLTETSVAAEDYAQTSFTITPREISVTQRNKTHVYDAYEHIEDAAQFEFYSTDMTFDGVTYNVNLYSTTKDDNVSARTGGTLVATVHILGLNDFQPGDAKFENTTPGGTDTSTYWKIGTDNMNAYYVTLGSSDTHYSYADLDKLDSAKNGGGSYVQNKGTYYAEIELQTGNFKFASSSDFTPVTGAESGVAKVRATYTITAAVIGIAYSFYSQTYDPKRRFYFEVTLTDNTNGRTYKIGFKRQETTDVSESDKPNPYTLQELEYTTTPTSTQGLTAKDFLKELHIYAKNPTVGTWPGKSEVESYLSREDTTNKYSQDVIGADGSFTLPGTDVSQIGDYWLYAALADTNNYQLSVSASNSLLGNGEAYAESFSITPDNAHTVIFDAGETGFDYTSVGATLPVQYDRLSYGGVATLPRERYILVGEKRYTLVGWTKEVPTANNAWLYDTLEALTNKKGSGLWIDIGGRTTVFGDGTEVSTEYTIVDADGTDKPVQFYAIWALDNDGSGKSDWDELFTVEYDDGISSPYSVVQGTELPKTPAAGSHTDGKYMAGEEVKLLTVTPDSDQKYHIMQMEDGVAHYYVLYGWTEVSYISIVGSAADGFQAKFATGYVIKNADDMALLYSHITNRTETYTVRSQDAKDGKITLYAIWAPDNDKDGEPELNSEQYTVVFQDTTNGLATMPDSKTGPHGTSVGVNGQMPVPTTAETKDGRVYFTDSNGKKYVFKGWTLEHDEGVMNYVCNDASDWLKFEDVELYLGANIYRINASDADTDKNITLYAVWALDENQNDLPDWGEASAQLTYQNDVAGTVAFIEGYTYTLQNFQGKEDERWDGTFTAVGLDTTGATSGKIVDHVLPGKSFALPGLGSADAYAIKRTGTDGNVYLLIGWTTAAGTVEGFSYVFQYSNDAQTPETVYANGEYKYYAVGASYTMPSEEGETLHAVWAIDGNENGKPDYQETYQVTFQRDTVAAGDGCKIDPAWTDITYNNQNLGTALESQTASYTLTKGDDQYILVGFTTQKGGESVYFVDTQPTKDGDYTYVDRNEAYIVAAKDDIADGEKADNAIVFYAVWGLDANKDGKPDWNNDKYTVCFSLDPETDKVPHTVNTTENKLPDTVYKTYKDDAYSEQYPENQVEIGDTFYWDNNQYSVKHGDAGVPCMYVGEADSADRKHYILLGWTTNHALTNYLFESSAPQFTFDTGNSHTLALEDLNGNAVEFYAVWAIDMNENGTPDYDDKFDIAYSLSSGLSDGSNVDLSGTLPAGAEDLAIGATYVLSGNSYTLDVESDTKVSESVTLNAGDHYVLMGWTYIIYSDAGHYFPQQEAYKGLEKTSDFYQANSTYTVTLAHDSNKDGTITFYPIWALDNNGNGTADWDEHPISLSYTSEVGYDAGSLQNWHTGGSGAGFNYTDPTTYLSGTTAKLAGPNGDAEYVTMEKDDVTYMLVGWTTYVNNANDYYIYDGNGEDDLTRTYGATYHTVGAEYVVSADSATDNKITFYAVWAPDRNQSGTPDYLDEFTVKFDWGTAQAIDGSFALPATQSDLSIGQNVSLVYSGDLPRFSPASKGGVNYVLMGWTTLSGEHLIDATNYNSELAGLKKYNAVGGNYVVDAADATKEGVITLYAVWGVDENTNGTPDFNEGSYTVSFDVLPEGTEGTIEPALADTTSSGQIARSTVTTPGTYTLDNSNSLTIKEGENAGHYVLLGWTRSSAVTLLIKEPTADMKGTEEDPLAYFTGKDSPYTGFIKAGDSYTVNPKDADGSGLIAFYAVWGIDENSDGTEDWNDKTFTLTFTLGEGTEGTVKGAVYDTEAKTFSITTYGEKGDVGSADPEKKKTAFRVGETAYWSNVYSDENRNGDESLADKNFRLMLDDGTEYVLIGWTTESSVSSYLYTSVPTYTASNAALDNYNFKTKDNVTLYALWGIDANGDGTPDYNELYDIDYENSSYIGHLDEADKDKLPEVDTNGGSHYSVGSNVTLHQQLLHLTVGVNSVHYVLIGWTKTTGLHLFDSAPTDELAMHALGAIYPITAADGLNAELIGGVKMIRFYAVWGIDQNQNGTPDYAETFSVAFENAPDVTVDSVTFMPKTQVDLPVGKDVDDPIPDGRIFRTTIGATSYILVGWTTESTNTVWGPDTEAADVENRVAFYQRYLDKYDDKFYFYYLGAKDGGDGYQVYTVNAADASKENVITLYAVWAVDENENGTPDFDDFDRYTVKYDTVVSSAETNFTSAVMGELEKTNQLEGTVITLPGKDGADYSYYFKDENGTKYLLVGWTHDTVGGNYVFPNGEFTDPSNRVTDYLPVGAQYKISRNWSTANGSEHDLLITFYAVWAIDNEEDGKGDGIPDYLQEYTLRYENAVADSKNSPDDLPYTIGGQKVEAKITTRSQYSLTTKDGETYTLLGWTAVELDHYLLKEASADLTTADHYTVAGGDFKLSTRYAKLAEGQSVITLRAVWGLDANKNGTPDWNDKHFDVVYAYGNGDGYTLDEGVAAPEGDKNVLEGLTVTLAGMDESGNYTITATKDGKHYVLVGWSASNVTDAQTTEPKWKYAAVGCLMEAGHVYTLDAFGLAKMDESSKTGTVTLYAVWAEDNESNGTGDKTPDYANRYTLQYASASGTPKPALPADVTDLSVGAQVVTDRGTYSLTVGEKHYILIGWTTKSLDSYLFEAEPTETYIAKQGLYTVNAADANESYVITLYAVWGLDMNHSGEGNGTPDWNEEFTLRFVAGVVGLATDSTGNKPLPQERAGIKTSSGGQELLKGYSLLLEYKHYTLLGWTKMAPTSGAPYVYESKEAATGAEGVGNYTYTLNAADADENGVVTFYAVWGIDNNQDGQADYDQKFDVEYKIGDTAEGTLKDTNYETAKSFTPERNKNVGDEVTLPEGYTLTVEKDGAEKHYVLMGWTLTEGDYLCGSLEDYITQTGKLLIYGAGAKYTIDDLVTNASKAAESGNATVTFYAVWGIDEDEDGKADWETYTVVFESRYGETASGGEEHVYEISGPSWPLSHYGLAADETTNCVTVTYTDGGNYKLSLYKTTEAGVTLLKRYKLMGWTLTNENKDDGVTHLFGVNDGVKYSEFTKNNFFAVSSASTSFGIDVKFADTSHFIKLYAVWAEDNNDNGTPDWEDDAATVTFADSYEAAITEGEGKTTVTTDAEGNPLRAGMTAQEPELSAREMTLDGKRYILIGWIKGVSESVLLDTAAQYELIRTSLYENSYTIVEGELNVTLYAVWALDNENNGDGTTGDGTPDFLQTYTLLFVNKAASDTPTLHTVLNQDPDTAVTLPTGYTYDAASKHYVLVGWTLDGAQENYLLNVAPAEGLLVEGPEYTVSSKDAVKNAEGKYVITFYAVWGEDLNNDGTGNGTPDWADAKYTLVYDVAGAEGVTAPTDGENYLSGTTVELPKPTTTTTKKGGVNYVFVGWTTSSADGYFFEGEPTVSFYNMLGDPAEYVVNAANANEENVITLHAVWAADNEGEKGNGTPDYLQTYTVTFVNENGGRPVPADLPYTIGSLTVDTQLPLLQGYTLDVDGKHYVLVGWTLQSLTNSAEYLLIEERKGLLLENEDMVYTVASKDAVKVGDKYVITLHAVWAIDENNSDTADYLDAKFTLTYQNGTDGTVAGWDETDFTKEVKNILDGTTVILLGSYDVTLDTADGTHYVLVGWTTTPGPHSSIGAPDLSADAFFEWGTGYTVTTDTVLYAVWAADSENNGDDETKGDKIPDYKQSYTVLFVNAENGSEVLYTLENQDVNSSILAPSADALTKDGKRYVLIGWTVTALESYLVTDLPTKEEDAGFVAVNGTYTLRAADAVKNGEGKNVITLYAVWTADENSNNEADYAEPKYTVQLVNAKDAAGTIAGKTDLFTSFENNLRGMSVNIDGYHSTKDAQISLTTADGTKYLLVGWTTEEGGIFSRENKMPENVTVYIDIYTVNAAHDADDDKVIQLYAVWGVDANNNGTADWSENAYLVKLVTGADSSVGAAVGSALPYTYTYLLAGDEVDLKDHAGCRLIAGEHTYTLLGWTLTAGTYLCDSQADYEAVKNVLTDTYKVTSVDDEDEDKVIDYVITLYAVWGVDDNANGAGNNIADYLEEFTVSFNEGGTGGTTDPATMPGNKTVSGADLLNEEKNKVTLTLDYSLTLGEKHYTLIGWTLTAPTADKPYLFDKAPGFVLYTDTYTVRASDTNVGGNTITLYAVWGIDENQDGSPDWNDVFSVRLHQSVESGTGISGADGLFEGMHAEDLQAGDVVTDLRISSASSKIYLEDGGRHYVLVGWTTKAPEANHHIYDIVPSGLNLLKASYTVSAKDAVNESGTNVITLYAVWGLDSDNSGVADWEETLYYVDLVNSITGTPAGGIALPYTLSGLQNGKTVVLLASNALEIEEDGETLHYTLIGWRLKGPGEIVTETTTANFYAAGSSYTVSATDADSEDHIVFYAIWARDDNRNGKADFEEEFTVVFSSGTDTASVTGTLPDEVRGSVGTEVPLTASLQISLGGKNYTAFGWTLYNGIYLYENAPTRGDAEKIMPMTSEGTAGVYTVRAQDDFDGDGIIELYAVWGIDRDEEGKGDGTPDWQTTELYTVDFVPVDGATGSYTLEYDGKVIPPDDFIRLTENRSKKLGENFAMPSGTLYLTIGSNTYLLLGWTYESGTHLCTELNHLLALNGYFNSDNVDPYYAKDHLIKTYAVWAVDNNRDGTPDFSRNFAVHFENATPDAVIDNDTVNGGMPDDVAVQAGMTVNLAAYSIEMERGGVSYTLIGWAGVEPIADPYYAFETPSAFESLRSTLGDEVYTSAYKVDLTKMDSDSKVTLYAIWGIDQNKNGIPDWNDLFTVRFSNMENGVATKMPEEVTELSVNAIVDLAFGTLSLDAADGEHYVLIGWTLDTLESYLFTEEAPAEYLKAGSSYTVEAKDAVGVDITLYAVWGKDHNGNGVPDWEENFYEVRFVNDGGDALVDGGDDEVFRTLSDQLTGMEVRLGVSGNVRVEHDGVRYILIGWTLEGAETYFFEDDPGIEYFGLYDSYLVNAEDANDERVITLHAVWAIDGNMNDNPDWSEDYTLEFRTFYDSEKLIEERHGLQANDSVEQPIIRSVTVDGRNYVLFGWTLDISVAADLYVSAPGDAITSKLVSWPYLVKFADSEYRKITMYAMWGIDSNRNNIPDWEDEFTLRFNQQASGISGPMPENAEGLTAGTTYRFEHHLSLQSGGVNYTLIAWTRDRRDPKGFLYTEGYPGSSTIYYAANVEYLDGGRLTNAYVVNAADADGRFIDFYAVWGIDENGNGVPDWEDPVIYFIDLLGYGVDTPSDLRYEAGQDISLPDMNLDPQYLEQAVWLGWTLDAGLGGTLTVSSRVPFRTYHVPEGSRHLIKMYAVWGVDADIKGWVYADGEDKTFVAPRAPVTGEFRLVLTKVTGDQSHIDFTLANSSLYDALLEYLTPDLDAGNWELYAGDRADPIAAFTVTPRDVHAVGIVANDKAFDGTRIATLDLSEAGVATLYFNDKVSVDWGALEGTFEDEHVGTDKAVTVRIDPTKIFLTGADATNYNLVAETIDLTATIFKATIDAGGGDGWSRYLKALDKVYDGNTDAEIEILGYGWLKGFRVTVTGYTARFEDENAAKNKRVFVTLELAGEDVGNIELTEIVLRAEIFKAPNAWIVEYGRVENGIRGPVAVWQGQGEPTVEFFYDYECTRPLQGDLSDQFSGTYYARVTVAETQNWYGLSSVYAVEVEERPLDITACVMLLVAQVVLLLAAAEVVASKNRRDKEAQEAAAAAEAESAEGAEGAGTDAPAGTDASAGTDSAASAE